MAVGLVPVSVVLWMMFTVGGRSCTDSFDLLLMGISFLPATLLVDDARIRTRFKYLIM